MKKIVLLTLSLLFVNVFVKAQFGYIKKSEVESFKDSRLVVVLFNDSSYNASIRAAVEKYWRFNSGYEFVSDTALKPYMNKSEYSFLVFSKSKPTRLKNIKVCLSEDDINGLVIAKKFKRKVTKDLMIASAFCGNAIDSPDWYPELTRAVQLLNNFFDLAIQGNSDREISSSFMMSNYPTDKSVLGNQTLYINPKLVDIKPTEDIGGLWGGDVEEVLDNDEIYPLILNQDPNAVYYYQVIDEKFCNKLFVSAANSELMYYSSTAKDKCKCTAKDLKALKSLKDKANR